MPIFPSIFGQYIPSVSGHRRLALTLKTEINFKKKKDTELIINLNTEAQEEISAEDLFNEMKEKDFNSQEFADLAMQAGESEFARIMLDKVKKIENYTYVKTGGVDARNEFLEAWKKEHPKNNNDELLKKVDC